MSVNMSYCRWQNTELALQECSDDLLNREADEHELHEDDGTAFAELSRDEAEARSRTLILACRMLQQIGVDVDERDVEGAIRSLRESV